MTNHSAWETVDVLFARADNVTGAITVQLGDVLSGEVIDEDAPVQGMWGFLSMPAPPIPGVTAAEAFSMTSTNTGYVIGGRSVRSASIAGLMNMGESCIFADGSQACTKYNLDGAIVHFTTQDNTATGQAVYARTDPDGHSWVTPWTKSNISSDGFHFFHIKGASLDFGYIGLSGPFAVLADTAKFNTYFNATAHMMRFKSEMVVLGSEFGVVPVPVVKSLPLAAVLTSLTNLLAQLAIPGNFVAPPSGGPVVLNAGILSAITAAEAAIATAVADGPTSMSSTSVMVMS